MADQKIGDAANGTKSTLDGTEKLPITGTQNALVSGIKDYAKTIFDTLYSAFNHSHADSDNGGIVNHTVLTNAGTSLHVPTYSSDSTTFLNGMGEWTVPAGGVTLSSDSTQYYNGIGEFTVVTDALLSFTDITTNNVSISKHGFTPKLSADSTLFLNGQGEWTVPPGTAGGITYSSDSTEYLNGKGEFTVPAGGGGSSPYYLDTITLDGTYGDHFTAATLDAKWTRHNLASSDDIRQSAGGTWLRTTFDNAHADEMYLQSAPAGDWEIQVKIARESFMVASMIALVAVDSSGNGCNFMFFADGNVNLGTLVTYGWGTVQSQLTNYGFLPQYGATVWLSLARTGTTYVGRLSVDGSNWSRPTAGVTVANTIDRFGFGRIFGANAGEIMVVDWFNKI